MFDHLCLSLMNRWGSCPFKTVVRESYWLANAHCWLEIKPLVVSCLSLLDTATRALCSSSTLIRVMQQKRMCSSQEEMQVLSSALSGSCLTIAAWATVMTHSSWPTISSALWGRVIWWLRKTAWPLQKLCSLCFLHLWLWWNAFQIYHRHSDSHFPFSVCRLAALTEASLCWPLPSCGFQAKPLLPSPSGVVSVDLNTPPFCTCIMWPSFFLLAPIHCRCYQGSKEEEEPSTQAWGERMRNIDWALK